MTPAGVWCSNEGHAQHAAYLPDTMDMLMALPFLLVPPNEQQEMTGAETSGLGRSIMPCNTPGVEHDSYLAAARRASWHGDGECNNFV